MGVTI